MVLGRLAGVGIGNSVSTPSGVMRPMLLPSRSVNQTLPSGPPVISHGAARGVGTGNSLSTPSGVMRPIRFPGISVNHRFPSGPAVITRGCPPAVTGYSVTAPVDGTSRPIAPAAAVVRCSVNHTLPSDPTATELGLLDAVGTGYSVIDPSRVIWPTLLPCVSANQIAPSSPTVIPSGALPTVGIGYSVTKPVAVMRPIAPASSSVNHIAPSAAATISTGPASAVGSGYSVKSVACPLFADAADENPATTSSVTAATHRPAGRAPPRRSKTLIVNLPQWSSSCALIRWMMARTTSRRFIELSSEGIYVNEFAADAHADVVLTRFAWGTLPTSCDWFALRFAPPADDSMCMKAARLSTSWPPMPRAEGRRPAQRNDCDRRGQGCWSENASSRTAWPHSVVPGRGTVDSSSSRGPAGSGKRSF